MSKATIRIPTPLRSFTGGKDEVAVSAATVGDALTALGREHQGILARVLNDKGEVRPFVNLYLGDRNIRSLAGLGTAVKDGDVVSIVPAVAGGRA